MRRWFALLLPWCVVTACAPGPGSDTPSPAPPSERPAPECPESGVTPAVGPEEAAMGVRVVEIRLANCGDRPYELEGHPAVRVLDAEGEPLDVRVVEGSSDIATVEGFDTPSSPVTLQPGDEAGTRLLWRNTDTGTGAPAVGVDVLVSPEDGRPWQPVEHDPGRRDGMGIDLGSTAEIGVSAWQAR